MQQSIAEPFPINRYNAKDRGINCQRGKLDDFTEHNSFLPHVLGDIRTYLYIYIALLTCDNVLYTDINVCTKNVYCEKPA